MRRISLLMLVLSLSTLIPSGIAPSAGNAHAVSLPSANAISSSVQLGEWQLREFKPWSEYSPLYDFSIVEASSLRVASGFGSLGAGYVFMVVNRFDLEGNRIQVHWNAYYTYTDTKDLMFWQAYIFDGAFDRAEMTDYFEENLNAEPMFDYTHVLLTHYPGPLGASAGWLGWRTDLSDTMDLAAWTSDYVTIMLRTYDSWTGQSVIGDLDWLKILDADGNEISLFDFSGNVLMEVTGTTHDYGVFVGAGEIASIYVAPSVVEKGLDESFSVDVKVARVTDLYSWEFKLYYVSSIVSLTQVSEGSFLNSVGYTLWMNNSDPNYNATHGLVYVGASLTDEVPGASGSGIIATMSFETLAGGTSLLDLQNTILFDSSTSAIPHFTTGGLLKVLSFSISPTYAVIGIGQSQLFALLNPITGSYPPYTYQWYLNDNPVSGATNATWTFAPSSSGSYSVYTIVTDSIGYTMKSSVAMVIVDSAPVSISSLAGIVGITGYRLIFKETINNSIGPVATIDYYWSFNVEKWNGDQWVASAINGSSDPVTGYFIPANTIVDLPYYIYLLPISGPNGVKWCNWLRINFTFHWVYNSNAYPIGYLAKLHVHPADITGDSTSFPYLGASGHVAISDATRVGLNWQKTVPPDTPITAYLFGADINGDGIINIADATFLGVNWQKFWENNPPP